MRMYQVFLAALALAFIGMVYMYVVYLRPVPPFQPTGKYSIGTTSFDFNFAMQSGAQRKINVRAWYPSHASEGEISLVSSQRMVSKTVEFFKMPEFLAITEPSLSLIDVPIAQEGEKYPVLVFNHGFAAFAEQNTTNMQELASNGYIVLSIAHPETSLLTEYTDGSYVYNNADLPAFVEQAENAEIGRISFDAVSAAVIAADSAEGFDEYWQAMQTLGQSVPFFNMQSIIGEWIEDSNALINAIAQNQREQLPTIFAAEMDGEKIGIFGHSLGGMTALAAALDNPNIKAVVNLDGPFAYDAPTPDLGRLPPTCMVMATGLVLDGERVDMSEINTPIVENSAQGGCVAKFNDAWHMNFTDFNYSFPLLRLLKVIGPADQEKLGIEINHLLVKFFDRQLKEESVAYRPVYDSIVEYKEF